MEAVATAAAAREPDEGEVLASWRRREGGAAVSLENDSPCRAGGLLTGGHSSPRFYQLTLPLCGD